MDKMGKNAGHSYTTKETLKALDSRPGRVDVSREEEPVRMPPYDEPEPDIAIVQGTDADYEFRTPTTVDVALLVEVSDSTLSQDRGKKLSGYARARIPVYWIINLVDRQVEVFSRPGRGWLPVSPRSLNARRQSPGRDRRPRPPSDPGR